VPLSRVKERIFEACGAAEAPLSEMLRLPPREDGGCEALLVSDDDAVGRC